jgi:hypothetical protein
MTPVEALHLATFLASVYPSVRVREEPSTRTWHVWLSDVDATDAMIAVIRLARRHGAIALDDISAEAHRVREERLTRRPRLDTDPDPDGPHHFRTTLPAVVTAMLSLRVPCPWCGAALRQPCTPSGGDAPLRRTPAHPARLIAVGLATGADYLLLPSERGSLCTPPGDGPDSATHESGGEPIRYPGGVQHAR